MVKKVIPGLLIAKVFVFIFILIVPFIIQAQEFSGKKLPVYFYAGLMYAEIQTQAIFDANISGIDNSLNLEDDLDFPSKSVFPFIKIIPGKSFQLSAGYTRLHRNGESELSRDFAIGDSLYTVGTTTKAYFNTDYFSLNLQYSLIHTERTSAGLSLGFRYLKLGAGLEATTYGQVFKRDGKFNVPVILPGVHLSFYLLPNTLIRGSVEYLSVSIKKTKGNFTEARVSAEHYFLPFLGGGIGYSFNEIKARDIPENDVYLKDANYTWKGMTLFASLRF